MSKSFKGQVPRRSTHTGHIILPRVDCICAGVPCQDVSIAGKRAGLRGSRTSLFFDFARLLQDLRPEWFIFENVPGLLTSNKGRDFAEVLQVLMEECGYGLSWRVLNSQFFGVPQRRRRLFIVGRFRKPCPPTILFEAADMPASLKKSQGSRDRAFPASEKNSVVAIIQDARGHGKKQNGKGISEEPEAPCYTLDTISQHAIAFESRVVRNRRGGPGHLCPTLVSGNKSGDATPLLAYLDIKRPLPDQHSYAHAQDQGGIFRGKGEERIFRSNGAGGRPDVAGKKRTCGSKSPDGMERNQRAHNGKSKTADPDRMGVAAGIPDRLDTARYTALGNAVTVNVVRWIAERLTAHM